MRLLRTNAAVSACKAHLSTTASAGTSIESFLTQHVLVLLSAEVESVVRDLVVQRAERCGDDAVAAFVRNASERLLRSVAKSEIAGLIGRFGPEQQKAFNDQLVDREVTAYSNAISNRHLVSHSSGVTVTFVELEAGVEAAERLLDAAALALV